MTRTCIIARHGNTFRPGQIPTRVGRETDLPLVEEQRARSIGRYLLTRDIHLDSIHAAPLLRTTRTAELIIEEARLPLAVIPEPRFTEIDHGPDENKTDEQVKRRLGARFSLHAGLSLVPDSALIARGTAILDDWNTRAIPPPGWIVDVEAITRAWREFADAIPDGHTVLICTSSGIIRFAPCLLDQEQANSPADLKVATGSLSIFRNDHHRWNLTAWNLQP